MEGLQRSSETFRRSGSSGLVWEDRFAPSGIEDQDKKKKDDDDDHDENGVAVGRLERSRSAGGGGGGGGYRTSKALPPAMDPPSPRVSVCGFCSFFAKPPPSSNPSKPRRR